MDLQKFLFRQRLQTTAILALLKGRQCYIVDKMSELVLQESSDLKNSSSDDELNLITKESSNYNFKKMIQSKDRVDKRLFEQYLIQQTHRMGATLGFKDVKFDKSEEV